MERPFAWIELEGKKFIFPFIVLSVIIGALSFASQLITPMLDQIGINITINYFGLVVPFFTFLLYWMYVNLFITLMKAVTGLIGELIRLVMWTLYLILMFVPFGTLILNITVPGMADVAMQFSVLSFIIFAFVIMAVHQGFRTYIQVMKYKERTKENISYSERPEEQSIGQLVVGWAVFAFMVIWVLSLFEWIALPQLIDFSAIVIGDFSMAPLNFLLNRILYVGGVSILYLVLKIVLKPK